jgi:hypothetical protein
MGPGLAAVLGAAIPMLSSLPIAVIIAEIKPGSTVTSGFKDKIKDPCEIRTASLKASRKTAVSGRMVSDFYRGVILPDPFKRTICGSVIDHK